MLSLGCLSRYLAAEPDNYDFLEKMRELKLVRKFTVNSIDDFNPKELEIYNKMVDKHRLRHYKQQNWT